MKTLALDQALKVSGWSLFNNGKLIKSGTFKIPSTKPLEERLATFWKELNSFYSEYEFEKLVFEDIQMQGGNVKTYNRLSMVQATLMLWCYFNEIPYEILGPSHWRKCLAKEYNVVWGGNREKQKIAAQALVKKLYNKDVTEDESDAICIGLASMFDMNDSTDSAF